MDEVTCPYCEEEFEVNHDDGAHYRDGVSEPAECPNCGKSVMIAASCSWYFEAEKADCLNGAPHPWGDWHFLYFNDDFTKKMERRVCQTCDEDEREWHGVTDADAERIERYKGWTAERDAKKAL